jgi:hypothetical protein
VVTPEVMIRKLKKNTEVDTKLQREYLEKLEINDPNDK